MFYGRLLDNNRHRCESLADLSYPVVLLQGRESGRDRFIESLRRDLYGVLNVSNILYRNCARSENHEGQARLRITSASDNFASLRTECAAIFLTLTPILPANQRALTKCPRVHSLL